jgi:MFS family permease
VNATVRRAADFLGLRRSIVALLAMAVLVGLGEKMAERFLPIYLLALGATPVAIGLLNGLDNLLSALYSLPGGWLVHRWGAKRALLAFNLLAMLGFGVVLAVPRTFAVFLGSIFFLSWTAISLPATMDLVARGLPPEKRTMGVSVHSLVRRIPMALGPILGGVLIATWGERDGVRLAFAAALVLSLVAIIVQQALLDDAPPAGDPVPGGFFRALPGLFPAPLRRLLVADILVRFCEQIPYAFVAVWCMKTLERPVTAVQFGWLTAIEMATAMLAYIPVAYLADKSGKKPFVLVTFVHFTLFPIVLYFSRSLWPLVFAFVVRGLKEFGEPTRKALILDLAPPGRAAPAFGAYYLARDVVVALAAAAGGLLWTISPAANLFTAAACGAAGTLWFAIQGEDLPRPGAKPEQRGGGE